MHVIGLESSATGGLTWQLMVDTHVRDCPAPCGASTTMHYPMHSPCTEPFYADIHKRLIDQGEPSRFRCSLARNLLAKSASIHKTTTNPQASMSGQPEQGKAQGASVLYPPCCRIVQHVSTGHVKETGGLRTASRMADKPTALDTLLNVSNTFRRQRTAHAPPAHRQHTASSPQHTK